MFKENELMAELARHGMTKGDLAEMLGMSRPTLDSRFKNPDSWNRKEISIIKDKFGRDVVIPIFFNE